MGLRNLPEKLDQSIYVEIDYSSVNTVITVLTRVAWVTHKEVVTIEDIYSSNEQRRPCITPGETEMNDKNRAGSNSTSQGC